MCVEERALHLVEVAEVDGALSEESSSVHPNSAGDVVAPVRVSGTERKDLFPTVGLTSPMLVGRDPASCHDSGPALASMGQRAPAPAPIALPQQKCSRQQPTLWDSAA